MDDDYRIILDNDAFKRFEDELARPAKVIPELAKLLAERSVLERRAPCTLLSMDQHNDQERPPVEPWEIAQNMPPEILRYFTYDHLDEGLQAIARPIAELAHELAEKTPKGPEQSTGLRKLLEAKDAFVRAALDK